ncbi:MAG: hypothetical protein JWL91_1405 [Sphingomonas bacterium]|nr:L,D-transpeptidase family protein [Sphingomonas bacterium]MDB5689529.1 hypothetical protein [Sphingomonas bacterium]
MRRTRIPALLLLIGLAGSGVAAPANPKAAPSAKKAAAVRAKAKAPVRSGRKPAPRSAVKTAAGGKAKPVAKPAPPPPSPAVKAIAVEIRAQASGAIGKVYAGRGYWPLWAATGRIGREADAFLAMLDSAGLDGLRPGSYGPAELRKTVAAAASGEAPAVAAAELALSRAYAGYVADVRRPPAVGMTYLDAELKPRRLRARDVLRQAAMPTDFAEYVASMGWMSPHYVRLRTLVGAAQAAGAERAVLDRLRLNLDRARLLPGPWVRHIVVDAASARLFYYQGGKQQGTMRVVVGTPETPTPMLAGMVRYAILNPYWNVPTDLVRSRIAPRILAGKSLTALRFEALSDWSPSATRLDPRTVDWNAVAAGEREVRLRQLPGGSNAMGKMKFMFPNDLGIYLHDTPDKALMAKPARYFSNGCVRLEDAPKLGRWMFGKSLVAAAKRPEQDMALTDPVPVYLTYFTATSTEGGFSFLPDVYGRDGKTRS